jgi:alkylation response protein AidB-like acyl-CoA dehydrogenase
MTTMMSATDLLTDELLARFDERAPVYDREHRFFQEDFDELRERGYLTAAVPAEFGGAGLTFAEIQALQRRLAYVAPATALAVNMHFYWTGVAAELAKAGDSSCEWILRAAVDDGAVFAAGHGEAGNDIPVLLSSSAATRVD